MSHERRQDLLYPPGPRLDQERVEDRQRAESALTLAQRLHAQLWPLRPDETALARALERMSPLDRPMVPPVPVMLLGELYVPDSTERAAALCRRAWGIPIQPSAPAQHTEPLQQPAPPPSSDAETSYRAGRVGSRAR